MHDALAELGRIGRLAVDLDERQYDHGHCPCLEAAVGQEIQEILDARAEPRWTEYAGVRRAGGR